GGGRVEVFPESLALPGAPPPLQGADIDYDSADPTFLPSMSVPLDVEGARSVFRLIEALEDSDEVQNVYANFDVSDDTLELVRG
ncbi:MAG: YebC/PmpR family DNA-binding transcriptional regulator, partial [Pseudonocardia sp.]